LPKQAVEYIQPSVQWRNVIELEGDRIDNAAAGSQHARRIASAAEAFECPLEELSRRARAGMRACRTRGAQQVRTGPNELRREQVQPAGQRLVATLSQQRITFFHDKLGDLIPIAGLDQQRDSVLEMPGVLQQRGRALKGRAG